MPSRRAPLWRTFLSWVFLLLFCLAAPVALVTGWARLVTSDAEAYTRTTGAIAGDPGVQAALADAVAQHVASLIGGENPTASEAVLQRLVVEEVSDATHDVLASPEFATVWEAANRQAFAFLLAELAEGAGEPVDLDLSPLAGPIQAELDARDLDVPADVAISPEDLQFELLDAGTADQIRRVLQQLALISWGSLAGAVLALILAVGLGDERLRVIARAGFGLAVAMVILIALLLVSEGMAAKAAGDGGGDVVLIAIADAVSQGLRVAAICLALVGLVLAGIFAGLSALARSAVRRGVGK